MNLNSKKYLDLATNDIVTVMKVNEDIAVLDTMERVSMNKLLDSRYYEEQIDPKTFGQQTWNTLLSSLNQEVQKIPMDVLNKIEDDVVQAYYEPDNILSKTATNETAGVRVNEEDEMAYQRRLIAEKYQNIKESKPVVSDTQQQLLQTFTDDEDVPTAIQVHPDFLATKEEDRRASVKINPVPNIPMENVQSQKQPIQNSQPQGNQVVPITQVTNTIPVSNPIIDMFENVKRNKSFNVSIDYENKIPRLDFIEIMEDSYKISIIDYLANKFTNELLSNPDIIKDKIKDRIRFLVYGEESKNEDTKKEDTKKENKKKVDIVTKSTEGVEKNEIKKRKPYTKRNNQNV